MSSSVPSHGLQMRTSVSGDQVEVSLVEVEVPEPRPHEVVVRVEAAPINPSDLGLLLAGADVTRASAGGTPERPVITAPLPPPAVRAAAQRLGESLPVGNEGAGTVVSAGSDDASQALVGRTVAVAAGAMYSQYRCVPAAGCLALPEGVTAVEGAGSFVNPMTVLGMVETMRMEGHSALVHTAAASNLGQMLNRVCVHEGVPLVNVVRSSAQVELLRGAGAVHVCDSSTPTFMEDLVASLRATSATIAFDAVGGGSLASRILAGMEAVASAGAEFSRYGSSVHKQVYIYGALDRSPTELTRSFGMAWGVGGWLLTPFLVKAGAEKVAGMRDRVGRDIRTTFASSYTDRVSLAGALEPGAVAAYSRQATGQKYLVTPQE